MRSLLRFPVERNIRPLKEQTEHKTPAARFIYYNYRATQPRIILIMF